jgi:hypothetical protein
MRTLSAFVLAVALGFAPSAHAGMIAVPNLTGTWTGKLTCKGIGDSVLLFGSFNFTDKEATLEITQSGDDLAAALDADDPDFPAGIFVEMCGSVVVDPAKPEKARAGLAADGFIGSAFAVDFSTVKVFPPNAKGVTGKLTGSGVLISSAVENVSGTCKYTFERTSEDPPVDPATCDDPI